MTMKAVAFKSYPEVNGFVEKLVIFLVIDVGCKCLYILFHVQKSQFSEEKDCNCLNKN